MGSSDEQMMFEFSSEEEDPLNVSVPEITVVPMDSINDNYIRFKNAARGINSQVMFCLPKDGRTIADLLVAKVKTKELNSRNEAAVLREIHQKVSQEYKDHFPQVKEDKIEDRWLVMTAYNKSITIQELVDFCVGKKMEVPMDLLAVLLHRLAEIFEHLDKHDIKHGDIHGGNILLQIGELNAFPPIRLIDFELNSEYPNISGLRTLMFRLEESHQSLPELSSHWKSFQTSLKGWKHNHTGYTVVKEALEQLIKDTGANKSTLSKETRELLEKIADWKCKTNMWVTEEDIQKLIGNARSSDEIGT